MDYKDIPTYAKEMGVAVPGMILGTNEHVVLSKQAKEDMPFGAAVFFGNGDAGHLVTSVNTEGNGTFAGIAQYEHKTAGCYEKGDMVSVIRKGQVYVQVGEAVKAGGKVFINKVDGAYKASAGSSAAIEVNAIYMEDGGAKAFVPVLVG